MKICRIKTADKESINSLLLWISLTLYCSCKTRIIFSAAKLVQLSSTFLEKLDEKINEKINEKN